LRATNIQDEKLLLNSDLVYVPIKYIRPEQYLRLGDIVVCMSSGSKKLVGKTAQLLFDWEGSFGTFCALIRPKSTVNARFLGYFFSSPEYRQFISEKASGININNLKPSDFEVLQIPLPPLEEQERIVAKIEALFSQQDAGVSALQRIQAALKRYRASVLKAAFEGKLVPQDPSDESAEALLRRLGKEPAVKDDLPDLPAGWCWVTINDITVAVNKVSPQDKPNQMFEYIDISTIDNKKHEITEPKSYIGNNAPSRARQLVHANDVLFSTVRTYLENIALVPPQYDRQIASTGFCVLRANEAIISKFLFFFTLTKMFIEPLNELQRGTSYPAVRDSDVRNQLIPLPPFLEQIKIINEIEQRFSVIFEVEKIVTNQLTHSNRLRQAIMKSAFEGRLA